MGLGSVRLAASPGLGGRGLGCGEVGAAGRRALGVRERRAGQPEGRGRQPEGRGRQPERRGWRPELLPARGPGRGPAVARPLRREHTR